MRGINRLKNYARRARLLAAEIVHLKNWSYLRQQAKRARSGELVTERPQLQFRNGLRINMVPGSFDGWDFLFREIFLEQCYRPSADFVPRQGWTVIDLGANMGFFTCQCGFEDPTIRIVAVEPLPLYAETLQTNITDNRLVDAHVIHGAICGEPNQTIPISVWYTQAGELKTGVPPDASVRKETIEAKGYTLPEVFQIGEVKECDLLKVDIEGAEYSLFEKVSPDLWKKIRRVVMEVHNDTTHSEEEIVRILEQNHFKVKLRPDSPSTSILWAVSQFVR